LIVTLLVLIGDLLRRVSQSVDGKLIVFDTGFRALGSHFQLDAITDTTIVHTAKYNRQAFLVCY